MAEPAPAPVEAPPTRLLRRGWVAPLAGALLVGLVAVLLLANYRSARTLRDNLLRQHAAHDQLHAAALHHFLDGAVEAIRTVAGSGELASYYEGRDLGMSMQYGLALSLVNVRERLRPLVERTQVDEPAAFRRVALLDEAGRLLADSASFQDAPRPWAGPLDPELRDGRVLLTADGRELAVVRAHWWKGRLAGYLVGWLRAESVSSALLGVDERAPVGAGFLVLSDDGRAYRPDPPLHAAVPMPPGVEALPADGGTVELEGGRLVAARVDLPGQPFSVVLVRRAQDLLGGVSPGASALGLALAALATLLVAALAVSLNTSSLVLRARLDESLRREREVAEKHAALEREAAERRRLEAAHALLAMAAEQAAEGIAVTGTDGVFQYVNPAFERMTGRAARDVLGQPVRGLLGEAARPAVAAMARALEAGDTWQGELAAARSDGSPVDLEVVVSPVRDEGGTTVSFVAVARDVTEERRLRDQLRHAQKLEAVGTLAGGVAHDFNNLLTAIKGYADAALDEAREGDPLHGDLLEIQRAAQRGADLVRQLLAFGRKQVLRPQVVDLDEAVMGVEKLLRRLAGEHVELVLALGAAQWRVLVDPGQLEQVLVNLVVNARDAMPRGGRVTIATSAVRLGEAEARRFLEGAPGEFARLTVSDVGEGMDASTQARVFEPFFTTKPRGQGTGLGLSTVFGIVRQSHGFIGVQSAPGAGTRFDVFLPRETHAAEAAAPDAGPERRPAAAHRAHEVLLLAEDEPQVRSLIARQFQAEGYTVLAAADGAEACELLERRADRVHLLLTDMVMPRLGGAELARRFRERHPGAPVVFMSGYAEERAGGDDPRAAGAVFVQKPFAFDDLADTVRRLLDRAQAA